MHAVTPHSIRDVFSYSQRYKNKTFVLYIDDAIFESEASYTLIRDIVYMVCSGMRIMIIPGVTHSALVDEHVSDSSGASYQRGTVLSEEHISTIQRASFDVVSQIITYFARYRQTAVIGNWTLARSYGVINGVDYKHSGFVDKIDLAAVDKLLRDGIIPIFPAIGWSYTGRPYYLNPMDVATQASIMMRATKLIFILKEHKHTELTRLITNAMHSKRGQGDDEPTIRRMTVREARHMLERNTSASSYSAIIKHAVQALEQGIERVHALNGLQDGSLLTEVFSNRGSGLMMYADKYAAITPMQKEDVADVLLLMKPLIEREILKPRSIETLIEEHEDFVVYKTDGHIRGVAALHNLGMGIAEIAALATSFDEDSRGVGTTLMQYLLAKAKKCNYKRVLVFTLKTGDWFERLGFVKMQDKTQIPKDRLDEHLESKRKSRVYYMDTNTVTSDM